MTTWLLPRQIDGTARHPALTLWGEVALVRGRLHEACGGARRSFAVWVAGALGGPVLWIRPGWGTARLNGDGLSGFADPGRFLFVDADKVDQMLWTMEEALRSGVVPLVVAELDTPPGLTPVRRLHLAAEAGATAAGPLGAPLGLILTAGQGGAQGVESRWHLAADHADAPGWQLTRLRARSAPPKRWRLEWRQNAPQRGILATPAPRTAG